MEIEIASLSLHNTTDGQVCCIVNINGIYRVATLTRAQTYGQLELVFIELASQQFKTSH